MLHFPGQFENEIPHRVIRKHRIVYIKVLFGFFLVAVFPLAVFLLFYYSQYPLSEHPTGGYLVGAFACVFLLYAMLFAVISWLHEAFDLLIITNERLVDFTQINLLKRSVASTPLNKIQDATGSIDGFFPTIFNYGTIDIETAAGDASNFSMDRVPDPNQVAKYILDQARQKRAEGSMVDEL